MSEIAIGVVTLLCVLGGALAGMGLRGRLPEHHLRDDSKDVVRLVSGLLATLSAMVLGLLVASSKGSYDQVNEGIRQVAARVVVIDRLLAGYGREGQPAREELKRRFTERMAQLFPEHGVTGKTSDVLPDTSGLEGFRAALGALTPATEAQRAALAQIHGIVGDLTMERWLTYEKARGSVPAGLLVVLVSWLVMMFASFGMFAPRNGTVLASLFIGALAVSTSIFLIEEMSRPFEGLIALSPDAMRVTLALLGR
jgi:hypothetical protein